MFQKIYNKCRDKSIIVYLPDDYYQSEERYPVLYMNDGQNAFLMIRLILVSAGVWRII